jgi:hypothetical protein
MQTSRAQARPSIGGYSVLGERASPAHSPSRRTPLAASPKSLHHARNSVASAARRAAERLTGVPTFPRPTATFDFADLRSEPR